MRCKIIFLSLMIFFFVNHQIIAFEINTSNNSNFLNSGKIKGKIIDAETNEELIGVNCVVKGTTIGAASDVEGNYFIINLSPGKYTLAFSLVGYSTVEVSNVEVISGLTTTIDVKMSVVTFETETVTIIADKPLIRMDNTGSISSIGSDDIAMLPVQNVNDLLRLQAGVVSSDGIHIRGGRSGEVAYWVDGVATTDVFSGNSGVTVENAAVQELQVISGTFNAEYGQAMSGIVNIVTKDGKAKYEGTIEAYVGDYLSSDAVYSVNNDVDVILDNNLGKRISQTNSENPLSDFNKIYNVNGSLSGPIPFATENLTFFFNGRYQKEDGYLYGNRWFKPNGSPGDSTIVPLNPLERYNLLGKLTFKPFSGAKLTYSLFYNKENRERTYNLAYKYNPDGTPQVHTEGMTHLLSYNQVLSPSTFFELRVSNFSSDFKSYVFENPYASSKYLVKVFANSESGSPEFIFDPDTEAGRRILDSLRIEGLVYFNDFRYISDPNGPVGYIDSDLSGSLPPYSFNRDGMSYDHTYRTTSYWVGKFDLTSQIDEVNQFKTGIELRLHDLDYQSFTIRPKIVEGEELFPFVPDVYPKSSLYFFEYNRKPTELSAYLQDKIELKTMIVNIGIRFDYFDPDGVVPTDPSDPNIYDPIKNENIYKNWIAPDRPLTPQELTDYQSQFETYSPEERRAFMHTKVNAKTQISPRIGLAFPITDKGVIHFSYGHFFQMPEFRFLYDRPDFKLDKGGDQAIFGNADLNPQKTVMYEIGLQQELAEDIGFDITLFYRDIRDWVGTSPFISTPIPSVKYVKYENKDYANVKGVTIKLEKRYTNNFSAAVDYTYQVAEGSYSNPTDAFNAALSLKEPNLSLIPLNWDQRHTLNGRIVFSFEGWTASVIGTFRTGLPFTPTVATGQSVGGTAYVGWTENSSRRPSVKNIDLYLSKRFQLGSIEYTVFINAYNVFDFRDELNVWSDTGTAEYTTNIDPNKINVDPNRVSTVEDYLTRPTWYSSPRQIQLGMRLGF